MFIHIYIYIGEEPEWQAKMMGRITESAIASLVVHMNRYGENYFKSGIYGSDFSRQEDVIYVIVLKFSKNMTKMDLIKENVHQKSARMQIINRLIKNGWVGQPDSETDKNSEVLHIANYRSRVFNNRFTALSRTDYGFTIWIFNLQR